MATNDPQIEQADDRENRVYVAGLPALTDPGPAAAGVVILDHRGRMISHRSYYLGHASSLQAAVRALLAALRLAQRLGLSRPHFYLEQDWLVSVLSGVQPLPPPVANLGASLHDLVVQLPSFAAETIAPASNPARTVALAPLLQWLPERTRRAERLKVRRIAEGAYDVESARQPGVVYRVHVPSPERVAAGESIRCECPDYQYRGVPCKHLLVVAPAVGGAGRLFYPEAAGGEGIPRGPVEVIPEEESPPHSG